MSHSEEYKKVLFDVAPDAIYLHDLKGKFVDGNKSAEKLLGYSKNELIGKTFTKAKLLPAEYLKKAANNLLKNIQGKEAGPDEFEIIHRDGHRIPVEIRSFPIKVQNKKLVMGIVRGISARKNAEKELRDSEVKFRSIFENAALGIFRSTSEGKYEDVNEAFARILGFDSPKRMIEEVSDISTIYKNKEDREKIKQEFAEKGFVEDFEVEARHPEKGTVWISINARQHQLPGGQIYYEGTIQDITERKIAEEKLKESRDEISRILENSMDGILLTAPDGSIYSANPAACKMLGRSEKEICKIGRDGVVDVTDVRLSNFLKNRMDKGKVKAELNMLRKDGSIFPAEVSSVLFKGTDGSLKSSMIIRDLSEQKQQERIQEQSKREINQYTQYLEKLNNSLIDVVFTVNPEDRKIRYANNAITSIFGYSQEECIGNNTSFLYSDKQDYKAFGEKLKNCIVSKKDFLRAEMQLKRKNGNIFTAEITTTFVKEEGKMIDILSVVRDVSEKIKYQKELVKAKEKAEENEKKLIEAQELSHVGSWELIFETDTVIWSKELFNIFERSYDLPAPKYSEQKPFYTEESFAILDRAVQDCIQYEIPYEIELDIITASGSVKQIISKGNVKKDITDKVIGCYGTAQDVTRQKKLELELIRAKEKAEESDSRLKLAVDSGALGIWDWNVQKNTMIWSDKMFHLYGIKKNEFTSNVDSWENGLHPEDKEMAINEVEMALSGKKDFNTIFRVVHPDGKVLHIKADAMVLRNKEGKPVRMIGINKDITESVIRERELIKAKETAEESDHLKTAFLANMSHEIRTPMNGILGFADLLKEPGHKEEDQIKYINVIEQSGQRMLKILNDLIDIARIEAGEMEINYESTPLNDQLEYLQNFFKPEAEMKGVTISHVCALPSGEDLIITDKEKVYAILTNLIKNALKFTKKGSIKFGYVPRKKFIEFFVIDSGIGIPEDQAEFIFERFNQAHSYLDGAYQGAGLGLAICKAYVDQLGGQIWVKSRKGKGSSFYFTIPLKKGKRKDHSSSSQPDIKLHGEINDLVLMIAEDDESASEYLNVIMRNRCKRIITANKGQDVIELMKNNPDINLILMDIKMPGMDGLEATRKLREFNKDVVIIAQTAFAMEGDREKALEAGCDDYISKPVKKEKLLRLIGKYIAQ